MTKTCFQKKKKTTSNDRQFQATFVLLCFDFSLLFISQLCLNVLYFLINVVESHHICKDAFHLQL